MSVLRRADQTPAASKKEHLLSRGPAILPADTDNKSRDTSIYGGSVRATAEGAVSDMLPWNYRT